VLFAVYFNDHSLAVAEQHQEVHPLASERRSARQAPSDALVVRVVMQVDLRDERGKGIRSLVATGVGLEDYFLRVAVQRGRQTSVKRAADGSIIKLVVGKPFMVPPPLDQVGEPQSLRGEEGVHQRGTVTDLRSSDCPGVVRFVPIRGSPDGRSGEMTYCLLGSIAECCQPRSTAKERA